MDVRQVIADAINEGQGSDQAKQAVAELVESIVKLTEAADTPEKQVIVQLEFLKLIMEGLKGQTKDGPVS